MRIHRSRIFPYRLPLKNSWQDAHGGFALRKGWLLCLETTEGMVGWGDCAPLGEDDSGTVLSKWHHGLPSLSLQDANDLLRHAQLPLAACCAVDTALSDLAAQQANLPLAQWLNPAAELEVPCNAILGGLNDGIVDGALAAVEGGFTVLKLKLGLTPVAEELCHLHTLAAHLPAGIKLRLDANQAWDDATSRYVLAGLEGLPVELLEEPLANPDLTRLANLQRVTQIPLAMDESLAALGLGSEKAVAVAVLKPMPLGGVSAAVAWAKRARQLGMTCLVTTTVDNAAGVCAAAHLAAAIGGPWHHGLATSGFLGQDVGDSPQINSGKLRLANEAGLNFVVDWKALTG